MDTRAKASATTRTQGFFVFFVFFGGGRKASEMVESANERRDSPSSIECRGSMSCIDIVLCHAQGRLHRVESRQSANDAETTTS